MQTLESLRRKIGSAEDLHSIVKTMKALAAVSIRQYEKAVESLTEFNRTTELGLHVVLADKAQELMAEDRSHSTRMGAIVFGSDQGMCGQFNEQVGSFTLRGLEAMASQVADRSVVVVGGRVAPYLEDAGQPVEEVFSLPGSVTGVTRSVQGLLLIIDAWRQDQEIDRVYLYYNRPMSTAAYRPQMVRLLPIEVERLRSLETSKWPSHNLPIYTIDRNRLLASLIRQHLFVLLFRAIAESQASENSARLAAMQAAERNIDDRLVELNALYHGQRQNSITSELLDIVSGFEVLAPQIRK